MDKLQELKQIKANLEKLEKEYKLIRADMPESSSNEMYYKIMENCYQMVSNLRNYVYSVEDNIYRMWEEHKNGHLPKINGAEKMENALEVLGISEDYELQKPVVYIRANRQGYGPIDVDLKLSK